MTEQASSYRQILRSSVLIGGASAISLGLGLVRSKALALLLGPPGVGLIGIYTAITDLAQSIAGMGVNQSGVRQIAESAAAGGMERAAATAVVLRSTSLALGLLGAAGLFLFAEPIANATFSDEGRANAVRLLAGVVLLSLITEGQAALLQGLRRIGDLAKARVLGAAYGAVAVIAVVYAVGERGIVPALVLAGLLSAATAVWYVRKLGISAPRLSLPTISVEAAELLKLGAAFMVSGFVTMGAAYVVRALVTNAGGLEAAGLYQAAWTLGGLYTGFILQAMGADFYPRLVGAIGDATLRNRLVNEQTAAGLMLAGAGIIATLALAPVVLTLLYSAEFTDAAPTLRWLCLGMALRVLTWPPGFLIVALNERRIFMSVEIAWGIINVSLTSVLVPLLGLEGAGIAFAASYVCHGIIVYTIVRARYGFRPDRGTVMAGGLFLLATAAVLFGSRLLDEPAATIFGLVVTATVAAVSLRALTTMIPREHWPRPLVRGLRAIGLSKAGERLEK